jgi:hypothetical protein
MRPRGLDSVGAEGGPDPGAVGEGLREDVPRVSRCRLDALVLGEMIDETVMMPRCHQHDLSPKRRAVDRELARSRLS